MFRQRRPRYQTGTACSCPLRARGHRRTSWYTLELGCWSNRRVLLCRGNERPWRPNLRASCVRLGHACLGRRRRWLRSLRRGGVCCGGRVRNRCLGARCVRGRRLSGGTEACSSLGECLGGVAVWWQAALRLLLLMWWWRKMCRRLGGRDRSGCQLGGYGRLPGKLPGGRCSGELPVRWRLCRLYRDR